MTYFAERLQDLIKRIERHFEVNITKDRLVHAIEEANKTRSLLKELHSFQGRGHPPLTYGDIFDILHEGWRHPRKVFNKALEQLVKRLKAETGPHPRGIKLMLTGSLLDRNGLIRLIEELGGQVATSDLCTGGRFLDGVALSTDPLWSLCEAYLNKNPCARMVETERRISFIEQEVRRVGARGVVYYSLKFCDPYLYEAPAVKDTLRQLGTPVLFIEGDYTGRVDGGTRTRLQAFLEMLGRNGA